MPKPRYMIHAVPSRMWYVKEWLIPSLLKQGIPRSRIKVWCDRSRAGNLLSCMTAFLWCGERDKGGDTWHLQDDVVISGDFAYETETALPWLNNTIVAGFCPQSTYEDDRTSYTGLVGPEKLWYSFQCIRIPDRVAGACADWYFNHEGKWGVRHLDLLEREGKGDDGFFMWYITHELLPIYCHNANPNLVEHVDDLLGGSLINKSRKDICLKSTYFIDYKEVEALKQWLEERKEKG
jgi:hypothetical protein